MASSTEDEKIPSRPKFSILAPSKFSTNSGSDRGGEAEIMGGGQGGGNQQSKWSFPGLKASKLADSLPSLKSNTVIKPPPPPVVEAPVVVASSTEASSTTATTVSSTKPTTITTTTTTTTATTVVGKVAADDETKSTTTSTTKKPPSFLPLSTTKEESENRFRSSENYDKLNLPNSKKVAAEKKELLDKKDSERFVFGQNLKERAENFVPDDDDPSESTESTEVDSKNKNGNDDGSSTKNLFDVDGGKKDDGLSEQSSSSTTIESTNKKSLTESAAEYCEAHAVKRKYEEVAVVTGEEHETNVLQMTAKLHTFNKETSTWVERGRGMLRLNDMTDDTSRLIMRSSGVLKVILNTKLFPGMSLEKPTDKSVRLTGLDDNGSVRIFLLSGSPKDIDKLYKTTKSRLDKFQQQNLKKPKTD